MSRKLRVGMVGGGGPANFFGAPHRRGDPDGQLGRADRRRTAEQGRGIARRGPRAVHAPRLSRLADDDQGGGRAAGIRADRLRDDRHAQRRPLRSGRRRRGGGHRRALREAADDHARRGPPAPRHRPVQGHVPFVVAYTYTGFPMVMLARELVHDGEIGEIRKVEAWYPQGWLATKLEAENQKQASWRVDPAQGGRLGLRRRHRHARLRVRPVRRRPVGHAGSAAGSRRSSPAARSTTTSPSWPSSTTAASPRSPPRRSRSAPRTTTASASSARPARSSGRSPTTPSSSTTPAASRCGSTARGPSTATSPARSSPTSGSPRAIPKASTRRSANLHRTLEWTIRGQRGETVPKPFEHPGIADGVAGMAFIEAAVASSKQDGEWVEVPKVG